MESPLNVEDHGEWLSFGLTHDGVTIPARISREAMEDHFGAEKGAGSLQQAYALDAEMIHARAVDLIVPGATYTQNAPLLLKTEDF